MNKFLAYINELGVYEKLYFFRLQDKFVEDITFKRNSEWGFINKCSFDLFVKFSKIFDKKDIYDIYLNNQPKFQEIIKGLDSLTKFIIFQPTHVVIKYIIGEPEALSFFIKQVEKDFGKRKCQKNDFYKNYYIIKFKENLMNFTKFYRG